MSWQQVGLHGGRSRVQPGRAPGGPVGLAGPGVPCRAGGVLRCGDGRPGPSPCTLHPLPCALLLPCPGAGRRGYGGSAVRQVVRNYAILVGVGGLVHNKVPSLLFV